MTTLPTLWRSPAIGKSPAGSLPFRIPTPKPTGAVAEYLREMTVFPKGKHDDQVDSTAQFLDWFKRPMPSWGAFELARRMAEKLKPPKPVYVRLNAPRSSPGVEEAPRSAQQTGNRHCDV